MTRCQNIRFAPEATITRALIPSRFPGVIILHLSDGAQTCIGMGGPAPGLRAAQLHGLTLEGAAEVAERHEAAAHKGGGKNRRPAHTAPPHTAPPGAGRWAAPPLSFDARATRRLESA